MSTTIKRQRKGFRAWLSFFIGLNIILTLCAAALIFSFNITFDDLQHVDDIADLALKKELYDTRVFKSVVADHMGDLLGLARRTSGVSSTYESHRIYSFENEVTNIACFVQNKDGTIIYNTIPNEGYDFKYDYLLLVKDNSLKLHISKKTDLLKEYLSDNISGYEVTIDNSLAQLSRNFDNFIAGYDGSEDILVVYALRSEPENFSSSFIYTLKEVRLWVRIGAVAVLVALFASILLLIYSAIKSEDKRYFFRRCATITARVWFEFKLAFAALIAIILGFLLEGVFNYSVSYWEELALAFALLLACFWCIYLIAKDLQYNKAEFFKHNSIRTLMRIYSRLTRRFPFERRMLIGYWVFVASELALFILVILTFQSAIPSTIFAILGFAIFVIASVKYHSFISDTGKLVSQINRIKSGDLSTPLDLDSRSDLQEYAHNLNSIQSGMSNALEEQLASERLKVDLITNVSHDLKTPLTSIISYIDLLKKEPLPAQAIEYADILSEKADKLNTMIHDIFAVSKATSGNLVVENELLDLSRLVEQTLADMQEKIATFDLTFRVNHVDGPLQIRSDGQKLYRVLQNLIDNALCYSLSGSRVHIRTWAEEGNAVLEIKNTSKHELSFTPEEIAERSVRGDASRSGEGSGLGLSIAQTFTEACGGSFSINIDYDDFKVRIAFPLEYDENKPEGDAVIVQQLTQSPPPLAENAETPDVSQQESQPSELDDKMGSDQ